jgi:carbon storage regulator
VAGGGVSDMRQVREDIGVLSAAAMRPGLCVCGCGRRGVQRHHVIYRQELKRAALDKLAWLTLVADHRNLVPLATDCHVSHHNRSRTLRLEVLPDSVFEFAEEVLGAGPGYEYLRRFYAGEDKRLDRLRDRADNMLNKEAGMLVLSRRVGERVLIGDDIVIEVVESNPGRLKLGITAPPEVMVLREELTER